MRHTDHSCVRSVYTRTTMLRPTTITLCLQSVIFFWIITFKAPQTQCSVTMHRLPQWCQWLPHVLLSLQRFRFWFRESHPLIYPALFLTLFPLLIVLSVFLTPRFTYLPFQRLLSIFYASVTAYPILPLPNHFCRGNAELGRIYGLCAQKEACREMSLGSCKIHRLMLHMTNPETPLISRTSRTTNISETFSCRAQTLKASFHSC